MTALLDVTERLIRERGFANTSVNRISAEAGLTSGAFYARFAGKDELLAALWERLAPDISAVIDRFEASLGSMPFRDALVQMLGEVTQAYRKDGVVLRELIDCASRHPPLSREMRNINDRHLQRLVALILEYKRDIAHPRPAAAATLGLVSVMGTIRELALEKPVFGHGALPSVDEAIHELGRMFLAYLEAPP